MESKEENQIEKLERVIKKGKFIFENLEVEQYIEGITAELVECGIGNPLSQVKIIGKTCNFIFSISDARLFANLEYFLSEAVPTEKDRHKLKKLLESDINNVNNADRIIATIDKVQDKERIKFIANATKSLIDELIDLAMYFRICNAICNNTYEDLVFLRDNFERPELTYSIAVQSLYSTGLMDKSSIGDSTDECEFAFTSFAKYVDQFGLSRDNKERYPDIKPIDIMPVTTKTHAETKFG